jgi:hypothetical protein
VSRIRRRKGRSTVKTIGSPISADIASMTTAVAAAALVLGIFVGLHPSRLEHIGGS